MVPMTRISLPLMAGVALLGLTAGARAQPAGMQAMRQACMPDYKAYCSGVAPGGGRILACLQQHAQSLSPDCAQALQSAEAAHKSQGG